VAGKEKAPCCEHRASENRASRSCRRGKNLARVYRGVKVCWLRWLLTLTSELGMAASRWTDRLTIALEEVANG
jgi:hypothetical protein